MLTASDGSLVAVGNDVSGVTGDPASWPSVSVVVPYYEAQRQLDLVLTGLQAQHYPSHLVEVVVVDDGSRRPPDVAAAGPLRCRVLRQPRAGFRAAAARNYGASVADGQLLCFLDGDTVPSPPYLPAAVRVPARCPDALVVGRRRHVDLTGWTPQRLRDHQNGRVEPPSALGDPLWLQEGYRRTENLTKADASSYRYVLSSVMTCTSRLWHELGGFDETFTQYGGEDWELAARAWSAGAVFLHEPAAVAWHDGPDWGHRSPSAAEKNIETLALAGLITASPARGKGLSHTWPAVVATVHAHGWSDAALAICLDGLLTHPDTAVWTGTRALSLSAHDSRVRQGAPPTEALTRAQTVVDIFQPCLIPRLEIPPDLGRIDVVYDQTVVARMVSARALHRARRWAGQLTAADPIAELFGASTVPADSRTGSGVLVVDEGEDEPDVAAYFGQWGAFADARRDASEVPPR